MVTVSGRKSPVARALFRPSKSSHSTLCRRSSTCCKISVYSIWSSCKRVTGRMVWRQNWPLRRARMHVVSLTSAIILAVVGQVSAARRNIAQKNAHASIWEAALSQLSNGVTFCIPRIRLVLEKKGSAPPPSTATHILVRSITS